MIESMIPIRSNRMNKLRYWLLVIILGMFLAPLILSSYWLFILTEVCIMALFASSLNLLLGYTGLLSFGQGAYYAVAAYTTALLIKDFSSSLWIAIGGGILCAAVASIIIGVFCVRLKQLYFAMLTLAFSQIIYVVVFQWRGLTGGDDGLPGITRPQMNLIVTSISLNSTIHFYYFTLICVIISIFIIWTIVHSPLGYIFQAIRDNSKRAEFMGIPVNRFRLIAFTIAGVFSGVSGSLYVLMAGFVSPELAFWTKSGDPVIMTLVGGVNTFFGPTLGAGIYTILHSFIVSNTQNWLLYFGIILLIIVLFFPQGILGSLMKSDG